MIMALEGWDAAKEVKRYEADIKRAQKKAARTIGKKNVRAAKRALGKVDAKRKKRISYKVRKNGTLVHIDSGVNARAREYGQTIEAQAGGMLRIPFDAADRDTEGDFVAPVDGGLILFEGQGDEARPIAILKKSVRIKPEATSRRLSKIASDSFDDYVDEIEKEISNV